jgi:hypothetical protein
VVGMKRGLIPVESGYEEMELRGVQAVLSAAT